MQLFSYCVNLILKIFKVQLVATQFLAIILSAFSAIKMSLLFRLLKAVLRFFKTVGMMSFIIFVPFAVTVRFTLLLLSLCTALLRYLLFTNNSIIRVTEALSLKTISANSVCVTSGLSVIAFSTNH